MHFLEETVQKLNLRSVTASKITLPDRFSRSFLPLSRASRNTFFNAWTFKLLKMLSCWVSICRNRNQDERQVGISIEPREKSSKAAKRIVILGFDPSLEREGQKIWTQYNSNHLPQLWEEDRLKGPQSQFSASGTRVPSYLSRKWEPIPTSEPSGIPKVPAELVPLWLKRSINLC